MLLKRPFLLGQWACWHVMHAPCQSWKWSCHHCVLCALLPRHGAAAAAWAPDGACTGTWATALPGAPGGSQSRYSCVYWVGAGAAATVTRATLCAGLDPAYKEPEGLELAQGKKRVWNPWSTISLLYSIFTSIVLNGCKHINGLCLIRSAYIKILRNKALMKKQLLILATML